MPGTELAVVRDGPAAVAERDVVDGWVQMASDVFKLAAHICDTDFVPDAYRGNAPAVAAAILAGRELGIGPMTSLRHVQVVKGSPSLSAEYKRARVLAAGHEFAILELNEQRCRVKGRRRGSSEPPLEVTFSMDDARTAGLLNPSRSGKPGAWQTRKRRMLFARAGSELCDLLFSDVVNGLATTDLLAEGTDEDAFAGYNEPDGQEAPKPAARTARRRTAAAGDDTTSGSRHAAAGKDRADAPADSAGEGGRKPADPRAAGAASPRGAQPLPPLPGEDDDEPPAAAVPATAGGPPAAAGAGPLGPEDKPEFGTKRHQGLVGVVRGHLKRFGYAGEKDDEDDGQRRERLAVTARLAQVSDLGSTNDLDEDELSAVADTLARCKNRAALDVLLQAAGQAGDRDG